MLRRLFGCIDNTTLNGTDSSLSVEEFCRHTLELGGSIEGIGNVAAVCVYPRFVGTAKKVLAGSGVKVAAVAGAFPHGQLPIALKINEVKYVSESGADEVDIVISRGLLLAGRDEEVASEVAAMREACKGLVLKVILETGELSSPTLIERASWAAIEGGADFIKTSTGKIGVGATLEAAEVMLNCIADYRKKSGKMVGFKAAGGIRTVEDALKYAQLAERLLGDSYVQPDTFRIGASSLTANLLQRIGQ